MKLKEETKYWQGYKKVYIVNYCIGEVGSLVWHSRGVYKSKKNANIKRDEFLKKIENLKSEYFLIFNKEFNYPDLNMSPEEKGYVFCNDDIRIANVVVTPYRIEDTFKNGAKTK